ncbi:4924_t:CDS:2 [Diversispora eburnea]|uniref:4924_t:CDS:1 n=1 Tax=Diversispora eburnea TaxID=1213867 RepID=A0A9N9C2G9_9GLOM|nr:4924_t:CDS:2 [Diversispora eburnea]
MPKIKRSKNVIIYPEVFKVSNESTTNIVEDILIIAGSYERILYGINGNWIKKNSEKKENQKEEPSFSLSSLSSLLMMKLKPIFIFPAHNGCIKTVSVGERYLASGSTDEIIKLYDTKKRKEIGSLLQHNGSITTLQFYNKTHLLSGSEDGCICIWRTKDWECLKILKGHKGRINSLAIHPSGKLALSVASDKTLRLWNLLIGQKSKVIKLGREGEVILWSSSGDHYAIMFSHEIEIYDTTFYTHETRGDLLITGSEDKIVRIYDIKQGDCIVKLSNHKNRIKDISLIRSLPPTINLSTPLTLLASISSDGVINIWILDEILTNINNNKNPEDSIIVTNPLTSYDTKSRLTCVTMSQSFVTPDENLDDSRPSIQSHPK